MTGNRHTNTRTVVVPESVAERLFATPFEVICFALPDHGRPEWAIESKSLRLQGFFAGMLYGMRWAVSEQWLERYGDVYVAYVQAMYEALSSEVYGTGGDCHPLSNPFDRGVYLPFVQWAETQGIDTTELRDLHRQAQARIDNTATTTGGTS